MPKLVLVVDDSMLIRYSLCRFLEERGFAVASASDGREALDALARAKPDLIITDLQMQKMSGSELIAALKSNPETAGIPIIIVTSKITTCGAPEGRADFTICKDVDIEAQLGTALDILCGRTKRVQTAGK